MARARSEASFLINTKTTSQHSHAVDSCPDPADKRERVVVVVALDTVDEKGGGAGGVKEQKRPLNPVERRHSPVLVSVMKKGGRNMTTERKHISHW